MKSIFLNIILVGFLSLFGFLNFPEIGAQLSPGDLSKAHSHLEGLKNCTQCHELGQKISESKCLNCHKALSQRIQANKGYHVSKEVKGKSCIQCHSDHHGLGFEMVRFNKNTFNHNLTGYKLQGKHATIDCKQCHAPKNIGNQSIKNIPGTYLGLNTNCLSCHNDYHQKTLSNNCASCHNYDRFTPATNFSHSNTKFPLTGSHSKIECAACHKIETRNGSKFQRWGDLSFNNCTSCHKDPHQNSFGANCASCHNTTSFSQLNKGSFNHSKTGFELIGQHKVIDCKSCHDGRGNTSGPYKEFANVGIFTCTTCHKDVHEGKLGKDCKNCHSEQSFSATKAMMDRFDHQLTGYNLIGKHKQVDCKSCHTSSYMTKSIKHEQCKDCHKDYHRNEFVNTDCAHCHDEQGFTMTSFGIERHQATVFPLAGAHLATICSSCHWKENRWQFRSLGQKCADCHANIHDGVISAKFMPDQMCQTCHQEESWSKISFDHNKTQFVLEGKHDKVSCRSCHFSESDSKILTQKFSGLSQQCLTCHADIHGGQFESNGTTDCRRCHSPNGWQESMFDHNTARFRLEGAHQKVSCKQCHFKGEKEGDNVIIFRSGKLDCINCHS